MCAILIVREGGKPFHKTSKTLNYSQFGFQEKVVQPKDWLLIRYMYKEIKAMNIHDR